MYELYTVIFDCLHCLNFIENVCQLMIVSILINMSYIIKCILLAQINCRIYILISIILKLQYLNFIKQLLNNNRINTFKKSNKNCITIKKLLNS